ncbi:MAG: hypothetical protein K9W44_16205 [Candidatus Lokiarchaeota archaeon]|nr:hypothetical protein [Candidatus Harpocratesius repetitus]
MDEIIINILLSFFLGVLLILFILKAIKTKHHVPFFPFSFAAMFIGAFISLILNFSFPSIPSGKLIALELMFFGLSLFFIYLFLESLRTVNRNFTLFVITFILLIVQQVSLIFIIFLPASEQAVHFFWFIADFSYNILGVIVNVGIAVPFYFKNFIRSRKKTALYLVCTFVIIAIGYSTLLLADIFWYYSVFSNFQDAVFELGKALPIVGFIMILAVYIIDIHHFYQVPSNLFMFMISDTNGNIIFRSKFQNIYEKNNSIDKNLPALLNTVNQIFTSIFLAKSSINLIMSDDVSMFRSVGKYYSAVIVTNTGSKILQSALSRFLVHFELKFTSHPPEYFNNSEVVEQIVALLLENFPFLLPEINGARNSKK